jgi:Zn-dependent protease
MPGLGRNSIRLFRLVGIDVFLHWSWFLVALIEIQSRAGAYSSLTWNVLEYLALFLIVVMHEFGHALACRQVGGTADQIVLWPLGGVAYVSPPPRPGAVLWSIVAGPLVNVVLIPVFLLLGAVSQSAGLYEAAPSFHPFLRAVATIIGFVGVAGLVGVAIFIRSEWLGILCVFFVLNCWRGLRGAFEMARREKGPRHAGYACPSCKAAPHVGNYWLCPQCKKGFDTFAWKAQCPDCRTSFATTRCPACGESNPIDRWAASGAVPAPAPLG